MKVIAGALPRPGSWYTLVQEISTSFGELCQYFVSEAGATFAFDVGEWFPA